MTLFCSFLFAIVFFQYLTQHLAKTKIPWINSFLTFSFFPTPLAVWNHCKILPEVADGFSGWASGNRAGQHPSNVFLYVCWDHKLQEKHSFANLVIKWWYLTIFNVQNNGSSIWWCETFILEEMMRLQDTSTNLQTSLATGLEKYANALIIQGKRKKNPPACFKNSLTQISVHRGEQGRLCLLTWC